MVLVALAAQMPSAGPVPVAKTRYGRSVLRFEGRTNTPERDASRRQTAEAALAQSGVQARWLEVVDVEGSPLLRTDHIPCSAPDPEGNEAALKDWVRQIHACGMAAVTWYPLSICKAGNLARADWRQGFIVPDPIPGEESLFCCPVSGYGNAMIAYLIEAIRRLGLDGVWFDGSAWTNIWQRPYALTCNCSACATKFRADTGHALPTRHDFDDPVFRKWVRWRFETFGAFIERAAREIRTAHPTAAVVINHYHRPGIPWRSAVPLDRYRADIITGSEATGPDLVDTTMRLCRAYGRAQSEVWRPFDLAPTTSDSADTLLHHALGCYVAGGHPSFGGDAFNSRIPQTAALMTPVMTAIAPHVRPTALPGIAIHVSQQTETFYFGRGAPAAPASDPYWNSLIAWTRALGEAHASPDYVFDADFRAEILRRHRAVLMPLSVSLGEAQAREALAYARDGGLLVLGPATGQADPEGVPARRNALGHALGFAWKGMPTPDGSGTTALSIRPARGGTPVSHAGMRTPVTLTDRAWRTLYLAESGAQTGPCVATRTYGKGTIIVCDTDIGTQAGPMLVEGGSTRCRVSREAARGGRYGLRYVDAPGAPAPYYPDLENRITWFGAPKYSGCSLELDVRLVSGAPHVSIEMRSSSGPLAGPVVQIAPDGAVTADGKRVASVPTGEWTRIRIDCTFASGGVPASYVTTVGGSTVGSAKATASPGNPAFCGMDWLVVYGIGEQDATFDVDNLLLSRVPPAGLAEPAIGLDFEEGPTGFEADRFARRLVADIVARASLNVRVTAPRHIRAGIQSADERILVHLHNRSGRISDLTSRAGPAVAIATEMKVATARSLLRRTNLRPIKSGARTTIEVGPVGLYDVIEITPAATRR
jgi:hypothetical protein